MGKHELHTVRGEGDEYVGQTIPADRRAQSCHRRKCSQRNCQSKFSLKTLKKLELCLMLSCFISDFKDSVVSQIQMHVRLYLEVGCVKPTGRPKGWIKSGPQAANPIC